MQTVNLHIPEPIRTVVIEQADNGCIVTSFKEYLDGSPGFFIERKLVVDPKPQLGCSVDAKFIRELLYTILDAFEIYPDKPIIIDDEDKEN
jgi:hypothetical protein